jgi:hypothetical protein
MYAGPGWNFGQERLANLDAKKTDARLVDPDGHDLANGDLKRDSVTSPGNRGEARARGKGLYNPPTSTILVFY